MPWKETSPMDERLLFLAEVRRSVESFATLCAQYGISRKTGYKWVARYAAEGPAGLEPRSRRPHTSPAQLPAEIVCEIVACRLQHPTWGAKKLRTVLARKEPTWPWPARSTIAAVLEREGLIVPRRRRPRVGHPGRPTTPILAPNDLWATDYKGQFRTLDGLYCYPLTLTDGYSRFLLACDGMLHPSTRGARPVYERVFREYGLPRRIRSDNGAPFATTALGRLSALSVWWIRLGIVPELIEPASPYQNGQHERMHRTLKAETTRPPASTCRTQQRRFEHFIHGFNTERPHEALAQRTPASVYRPSPRPYPARLPAVEYPAHYETRLVSDNGGIRWHSSWVNVSHVLVRQHVGLVEIDIGLWGVYFGPLRLGHLDERTGRITDANGRANRHTKVSPMSSD